MYTCVVADFVETSTIYFLDFGNTRLECVRLYSFKISINFLAKRDKHQHCLGEDRLLFVKDQSMYTCIVAGFVVTSAIYFLDYLAIQGYSVYTCIVSIFPIDFLTLRDMHQHCLGQDHLLFVKDQSMHTCIVAGFVKTYAIYFLDYLFGNTRLKCVHLYGFNIFTIVLYFKTRPDFRNH